MQRLSFSLILPAILLVCPLYGEAPRVEHVFDKAIKALTVSPDGSLLAVGGDDTDIILWDLEKEKVIHRLMAHTDVVEELQFFPDGKTLVSGSRDKTVGVWSVESGERQQTLRTAGKISDICLAPDAKLLAVAFIESNLLQLLDLKTGKETHRLKLPVQHELEGTNNSSRVEFSPDGKLLIAACGGRTWPKFIGSDSTISIWETADWTRRTSFVANRFILPELAISPDSQWLAGATNRGRTVKVWSIPQPKPAVKANPIRIASLIKQLNSRDFFQRESAQGELIKIGSVAKTELETAAKSDSAEVRFRARGILKKLSQDDLSPNHTLPGVGFDVHAVAFSPDGNWLATGRQFDRPGHVILFEMKDQPKPLVTPHQHGAWKVDFTPDGKQLITGRRDGRITFWNLPQ